MPKLLRHLAYVALTIFKAWQRNDTALIRSAEKYRKPKLRIRRRWRQEYLQCDIGKNERGLLLLRHTCHRQKQQKPKEGNQQ